MATAPPGSSNDAVRISVDDDRDISRNRSNTASPPYSSASLSCTLPAVQKTPWKSRTTAYLRDACRRILILAACITFLVLVSVLGVRPNYGEDYDVSALSWAPTQFKSPSPSTYLQPLNSTFPRDYNVLLEAHAHTTYSDGRLPPAKMLEYAMANNFNAIVVSDHNEIGGALEAMHLSETDERFKDKIIVIPAVEYSTCRIHINVIGVTERIYPSSDWPTNDQLKADIKRAHDAGGIVIVNHIPWSNTTDDQFGVATLQNHPTVQELLDMGVDGFEVLNERVFDINTYQLVNSLRTENAKHSNLLAISGMDWHHPMPAYGWNTVKAANFTRAAIMDELRGGRSSMLIEMAGVRSRTVYPHASAAHTLLTPLKAVADLFGTFFAVKRGMVSFMGPSCHQGSLTIHFGVIASAIFTILVLFIAFDVVSMLILPKVVSVLSRRWPSLRGKND